MTVEELIRELQDFPGHFNVYYYYDSEVRGSVDMALLIKDEVLTVVLADKNDKEKILREKT